MVCAKCGAEMDDRTGSCPKCATPVTGEQAAPASVKVPNHMILAVITTFFCCLIGGVIAIIFSSQVNPKLAKGDIEGAKTASRVALGCIIANVVIGLLLPLLIIADIAIPNFMMYRSESQAQACISNMRQLETAAEHYMSSHDSTPSLGDLCGPGKYFKSEPRCPKDGSAYKISRDNGIVEVRCGSNDPKHVLLGGW